MFNIQKFLVFICTLTVTLLAGDHPTDTITDSNDLMNRENRAYWSEYYTTATPHEAPSTFAPFVFTHFIEGQGIEKITEFGCGDARDSIFFASKGLDVTATDYAESVITLNSERNTISNLQFLVMDVSNTSAMSTLKPSDAYYARFFLHTLSQPVRDQFIHWLGSIQANALVFLEFRTNKDPIQERSSSFGETIKKTNHFRRFESLETVKADLIRQSFLILFEEESAGLSAFGTDNPVLARIVLKKGSAT